MDNLALWSHTPTVISYNYWQSIDRFQLSVDTYANWVMFIPESGRFSFRIANQEGESGFGRIVICPPHIAFHRETLEALTFHFIMFHSNEMNTNIHASEESCPHGQLIIGDPERLRSNLRLLRKLSGRSDQQAQLWKNTIIHDILLLASDHFNPLFQESMPSADDPVLEAILERLQTLAYTPFNINSVAAEFGLSAVQLTRKFKQTFSVNPCEYITTLRIHRIKSLLLESDYTLQEIAVQCGYDNGYYLSRIFSSRVGVSPSDYRKNNKV
ncbi:helix-turn-helix transcriptional regulator [Bacillus sp. FJAT-28004]|uniref:helix-turn-helix transcriptional regulator n=1 Tax=Bacillus sp. FJAT-28004 TaxID=1679165 RepID=UPI0006B486CD|nr:AraC family transcriptional regulator [Bacillus sp. FJAT-28004]